MADQPTISAEVLNARFDRKVTVIPSIGCWLWLGQLCQYGYGMFNKGPAHRFSYERFRGPIPPGLTIDHLCRHRWCQNPDHLEAVTREVNTMRGEGPCARHARKTECVNGHSLTDEANVIRKGGGRWRQCRTCRDMHNRRRYLPGGCYADD